MCGSYQILPSQSVLRGHQLYSSRLWWIPQVNSKPKAGGRCWFGYDIWWTPVVYKGVDFTEVPEQRLAATRAPIREVEYVLPVYKNHYIDLVEQLAGCIDMKKLSIYVVLSRTGTNKLLSTPKLTPVRDLPISSWKAIVPDTFKLVSDALQKSSMSRRQILSSQFKSERSTRMRTTPTSVSNTFLIGQISDDLNAMVIVTWWISFLKSNTSAVYGNVRTSLYGCFGFS